MSAVRDQCDLGAIVVDMLVIRLCLTVMASALESAKKALGILL